MIALTLGEVADIVAGTLDGPADLRRHGRPVPRLAVRRRGRPVRRLSWANTSTATTSPPRRRRRSGRRPRPRPVGVPAVLVADPVEALGALAHHVLSRLTGLTVVGITGSQGKTSTKDIVAQLLEAKAPTVAPVGSFNNEIGAPADRAARDPATRFLVAGDGRPRASATSQYLATMVRPRIGVVLNVGVAHVGEFGSQAGIAAAKGELVEALPAERPRGSQRRRPAGVGDGRRARSPACCRSARPPTPTCGSETVQLDANGQPGFTLAHAPESRPADACPWSASTRRRTRGRGSGRAGLGMSGRRDRRRRSPRRARAPAGGWSWSRAGRRRHGAQRRLQREPRQHARGARGAGRRSADARRSHRRGARRDARARRRRATPSTRRRPARGPARCRPAAWRSARAPAPGRRGGGREGSLDGGVELGGRRRRGDRPAAGELRPGMSCL